jgi:hypothetical protein
MTLQDRLKILPITGNDRLAADAEAHAIRTGDAHEGANGWILSRQRRRICQGWYAYGIRLLGDRVLVKHKVGGIIRYLPPIDAAPKTEMKPASKAKYQHASKRGMTC